AGAAQPAPAGAAQFGSGAQPAGAAQPTPAGAPQETGAQPESLPHPSSQHGGLMSEHFRWYVYTFV
ncbi:MAG: hypothetical protein ACK48R_00975, partial [Planctomyces sp.]